MNLEFGEVVEPVSRAFWDDYDCIGDQSVDLPKLEWIWTRPTTSAEKSQFTSFIIIEAPSTFIHDLNGIVFPDRQPLCRLNNNKVFIYDFPKEKVGICLTEQQDLNLASSLTLLLDEFIQKSKTVIAVSVQHSTMHKGPLTDEEAEKVYFVRGINVDDKMITKLPEPNIVTGLPAGICSLRKHLRLPFSCYVIFLESLFFDAVTATPVLNLFKKVGIQLDKNLHYKLVNLSESNLYT